MFDPGPAADKQRVLKMNSEYIIIAFCFRPDTNFCSGASMLLQRDGILEFGSKTAQGGWRIGVIFTKSAWSVPKYKVKNSQGVLGEVCSYTKTCQKDLEFHCKN